MSDIFREVDEALQQDKLLAIWKEYGSTIIAALAVLIISTALGTAYRSWDAKQDATETARLTHALSADNPQAALAEIVQDTRKGHSALGLMSAAHLHSQAGEIDQATTLYKQVAENKKSPRDIRDLARILYVQSAEKADISILQPLLANEKSPWVWHARLEAAVITAHNDENYAQALSYLKNFKEAKYIPVTLKQRAEALAHIYTLKAHKQKAEKAGDK